MSSIHFIPIQQLLNCNMCLTNFIFANIFPCNPVFKAKNRNLEPNHWRYTLNIVMQKKIMFTEIQYSYIHVYGQLK